MLFPACYPQKIRYWNCLKHLPLLFASALPQVNVVSCGYLMDIQETGLMIKLFLPATQLIMDLSVISWVVKWTFRYQRAQACHPGGPANCHPTALKLLKRHFICQILLPGQLAHKRFKIIKIKFIIIMNSMGSACLSVTVMSYDCRYVHGIR